MMAIEAAGLRKSFGKVQALRGVDLAVPQGSVCALLGPNGAGKTTAVRVLATLIRPDGGTALVAGHDVVREPGKVRAAIGLPAPENGAGQVTSWALIEQAGASWPRSNSRSPIVMNVGAPHASVTRLADLGPCGPEMSVVTRSVCGVGSGRSTSSAERRRSQPA
jgi:energy-coupling factor transporter ATP-binding protein EcfA2